ncbi:MAG: ATP-grasp domain-containing protein [Rhizomicrobium sp.]|nr:ATP-grasp domain-containing protein [Rhizomicrobium sp.]
MKVLVLHSDVPPDAPPEDQDTLIAAEAVAKALTSRGHQALLAPFFPTRLRRFLTEEAPDVVFNLVEGIDGKGRLAHLAPRLLEQIGVPYTGTGPDALIVTSDKPRSKRLLRDIGLPTPDWSEPPSWDDLTAGRWIVKCADEDASLGLDDGAVVEAEDVPARADACAARFGGRWFAERYVEGREFNVTVLERGGAPHVLPMAEMLFQFWPVARPRIVGYDAKWDDASIQSTSTIRRFGVELTEAALARELRFLCEETWELFQCRGAARIDFRVASDGQPVILEINPNPGIAPDAGIVAAALEAGLSYADLIEGLVKEALQ